MMDNIISVIVPIYKVEKYLCRCIDSILEQTYTNLEIILVDDGSPDKCGEICDQYEKKDKRIRVIHKTNGGLSDARNTGLDAATGQYIAFVDGDDFIRKDMYEKMYASIKKYNADMSICNFKYIGERGEDIFDNQDLPIKDGVLSGTTILFEKMLNNKPWYWVTAWNKLYKRSLFSDIRFPVGKTHEDEFIIHKLLLKSNNVACVNDMLYYYVQRSDSIMGTKYSVKNLDYVEALFGRILACLYWDKLSEACVYCNIAILNFIKGYSLLELKDKEVKDKIRLLKKMYNRVYWKLLFTNISFRLKIRYSILYFSPYIYRHHYK